MWKPLLEQGVNIRYVRLLAALYKDQCGQVVGVTMSRSFKLERGTKQCDPMSPGLFNAASEKIFQNINPAWQSRGWGIPLENKLGEMLTNSRFTDDIILFATSKNSLQACWKI